MATLTAEAFIRKLATMDAAQLKEQHDIICAAMAEDNDPAGRREIYCKMLHLVVAVGDYKFLGGIFRDQWEAA